MKKVCVALIFVSCLFALFFELRGFDEFGRFSFRVYVDYVSNNWKPFPELVINSNWASYWFDNITGLVSYLFACIGSVVHNAVVVLYGFFPFTFQSTNPYPGGGGGAR